jgi:hypothetical protein
VTIRNNKRAVVDFEGNRIFKQRLTSLCIIDRSDEQDRPELELYDAVTKYVSEFYNFAKQQNNRTMMFLLLIYQITQKKTRHLGVSTSALSKAFKQCKST